jgi:alanine racemase
MLSWVEINKSHILHNLRQYRKVIGQERLLMPVVKSNAYGHGLVEIAKLIDSVKIADKICVANSDEAHILIKNHIHSPIFILSYWEKEVIKKITGNNIELAVYNYEQAKFLSSLKKKIKIHLKVDTGTSRLGILDKDFISFVKKIRKLPNINISGIFTHFANSEEDNNFTREQTEKLEKIKIALNNLGLQNIQYHAACSAAVMSNNNTFFDGLRLGLGMYGYWPSLHSKILAAKYYPWFRLKPALSWKTKIIQIKELPKNTFIGYGCSYLTKNKTKIAILPIGYNEGYDRGLSNQGLVYIKGRKCPVLGRICMNLTMIDASKLNKININEQVELMGKNITPEDVAAKINTINYEVITRINPLLPRVYRF